MTQDVRALDFIRQLDRVLSGKAPDVTLAGSDVEALALARKLYLLDISRESQIRQSLRDRLQSGTTSQVSPISLGSIHLQSFPAFQLRIATWASAALLCVFFLIGMFNTLGFHDRTSVQDIAGVPNPILTSEIGPTTVRTSHVRPLPIPTPMGIPEVQSRARLATPALPSYPHPAMESTDSKSVPDPLPLPIASP
jgi:hypothetical protein